MAKKRKREKPTWKDVLGIGKDDKWESDKDYRRTKNYWSNSRLQARNPAGYEKFQRREQDYLDNKKNQKKQEVKKRERYTYGGRGSGEFKDIKNSLRDDAAKGVAAAREFRNKQPPSPKNRGLIRDLKAKRNQGLGTNPSLSKPDLSAAKQNIAKALGITSVDSQSDLQQIQDYNASQTNINDTMYFTQEQQNIAKLLGIQVLDSQNDLNQINQAQAAATALGIQAIDSENDIRQIREYNAANPTQPTPATPATPAATAQPTLSDLLIQQQAGFDAQIAGLEGQLGQANQAYAAAQQQMQAQLQAATAATLAAEQRAANMRNAFIPQANPSAMSVAYGDQRVNNRDRAYNQLSDLTIMSGLGTVSNPLAGLQLA